MYIKKPVILISIFLLIIFLRIRFSSSDALIYLIGAINLVSLIIVISCILEKTIFQIKEKLKKIPRELSNKKIKDVRKKLTIGSIVFFIIFGIVFFWKFNCGLGNDILTIFALGLSLLDEEIAKVISEKI